jgi:hypothetical protein
MRNRTGGVTLLGKCRIMENGYRGAAADRIG